MDIHITAEEGRSAFNADKMDEEGGSSDEPGREESKTAAVCRRDAGYEAPRFHAEKGKYY